MTPSPIPTPRRSSYENFAIDGIDDPTRKRWSANASAADVDSASSSSSSSSRPCPPPASPPPRPSSSSSSSSIGPLAPDLDDALNDGAIAERVRQGRFRE
jgi:hypothetical protein